MNLKIHSLHDSDPPPGFGGVCVGLPGVSNVFALPLHNILHCAELKSHLSTFYIALYCIALPYNALERKGVFLRNFARVSRRRGKDTKDI